MLASSGKAAHTFENLDPEPAARRIMIAERQLRAHEAALRQEEDQRRSDAELGGDRENELRQPRTSIQKAQNLPTSEKSI
jgi:hypothetical protein